MSFRRNFKWIIFQKGLSQKEVADLTGIPESTISRYVNGKREPNYKGMLKLIKGLGCTAIELFRGDV